MKGQNKANNQRFKRNIIAGILAVIIFFVGAVGGFFISRIMNTNASNTIQELLHVIDKVGYVYDEQTFERRELTTEELADAILTSLDDYATYYTPEEYSALLKKREGLYNNYGIGFYDTNLTIDVCYYNSPAYIAGVRRGDKIVGGRLSLEQENKTFTDVYDFLNYFRTGNAEQTIYITIERFGESSAREISFTLSQYEASYVSYSDNSKTVYYKEEGGKRIPIELENGIKNLPNDTAYIDFISFEGKADKQLQEALLLMKESGKTRLILDLRSNGGGQMKILEEVAASLIYNQGKSNFPIVYEEHKNGTEITYSAKNKNNDFIQKIVVLANQHSASASECLIGAIQHYSGSVFSLDQLVVEKDDNGTAKTYGKGIMQSTYTLLSGGAFTLTTAKLLWPDKTTCIHGDGIMPTIPENAVEQGEALNRAIEYLS